MEYINIIGRISLFILIACLMYKAICQWNETAPFRNWEAKRQWRIQSWKRRLKERPEDWWEWLKSLSGLKKLYFVLASIVVSIFLYSFWFIFPEFIDKIDDKDTSFYNLSLAVFAILSGLGAVFGFYTSIIRTETQEQGLVTDRINKAVEGLGKSTDAGEPIIEVRLGALYALERIAKDSLRDHVQIIEILCTYIHHNTAFSNKLENPRKDMQAAATIIGRRAKWPNGKKRIKTEYLIYVGYRIDLKKCDLRGAILISGYLRGMYFVGANMKGANLSSADATRAIFNDTDLRGAAFQGTKLESTNFFNANMQDAKLVSANLHRALIRNTTLINAIFSFTNMSDASFSVIALQGAKITQANLNNIYISHANMTNTRIIESNLIDASISSSNMSNANLYGSDLTNATIGHVDLSRACFTMTKLDGTKFNYTTMEGVYAEKGDFSTCKTLTQDHLEQMFCGIELIIPDNLTRPKHWPTDILNYKEFEVAYNQWVEKVYPNLPKLQTNFSSPGPKIPE